MYTVNASFLISSDFFTVNLTYLSILANGVSIRVLIVSSV